jgi:hypothetical protein
MKNIATAISAVGFFTLASSAAYAACTPSVDPSSGSIVVDASGCSGVQVTNAPSTLSSPGLLQIDGSGNVTSDGGTLQGTVDGHTVQINSLTGQVTQNGVDIGNLQTLTAGHTVQINTLSGQVLDLQNVTTSQGGQITALQGTVNGHTVQITDLQNRATTDEANIAANTTAIHQTNTRLNSFNGTGGTIENWASGVDGTLANHETRITQNTTDIHNLYGLYGSQQNQINNLSGRMDKAYSGIAMASAFHAPQVDPGHTFGLSISAADFAGVGGFSGAAKWRVNNNFAVGAGGAFSDRGEATGQVYGEVQW